MKIVLDCAPPSTTAQMKRINFRTRAIWQPAKMQREATTWAALLQPHRPAKPLLGPLVLSVWLTYPHVRSVRKANRKKLIPKTTRPDGGNAVKHLADVLVKLGFVQDDAQFYREVIERWHGPPEVVGIEIEIVPFTGD